MRHRHRAFAQLGFALHRASDGPVAVALRDRNIALRSVP
jgi:hypothetical protein